MENNIILASSSPRRKQLLKNIGLHFKIVVADIDERLDPNLPLEEALEKIAKEKALCVLKKNKDSIVIGADTVVVYDNNILTKPADKNDAFKIINMLSGNSHQVYTAVCVADKHKTLCEIVKTTVSFYDLSEEEINAYTDTDEPYDKAGAYGIQGLASVFVKSIDGDFYNVVGLPVSRIYKILTEDFGIKIL